MRSRFVAVATALSVAATGAVFTAPAASAEGGRFSAVVTTFQDHPHGSAVTYDTRLVPVGALAAVAVHRSDTGTVTELRVHGLSPNRSYGAHAHVAPCGATGEDAGPHFQHVEDPNQPSTDPAYANPENEIWLDFTTDDYGAGEARSEVAWTVDDRRPASVVIHEHTTSTEDGAAGTAGRRLACINASF
ncbi:superoxide dismutase family protein [Saccharomonospora sp. NB11]|jgi:Cu-Zn family superoxide dismutase|uniref:superoxide dismutase family protein n=1 Tax=Saccharomonospora sp. NB11 TaxID=1642298 RepID=UPI0018CFF1AB|nr:superoxide dismutase family protein [Saccharomonospora sp. NB11]